MKKLRKNLKDSGVTVEAVAKATGRSIEDVDKILDKKLAMDFEFSQHLRELGVNPMAIVSNKSGRP